MIEKTGLKCLLFRLLFSWGKRKLNRYFNKALSQFFCFLKSAVVVGSFCGITVIKSRIKM